ncbi:MAG: crossover junction endodeoxyribonuclease RuvC [Actinobacteria bacterium]|nr:crossover junction endodeoxyribonuclease RuvC [Actinomycetota bacterium]MBU1942098.1 crossover junction endodeoxyribonuclease RuvC [Actinomycetota bacterium]MBU2687359.1 crossover junction endodeoxyribonuclease RuvC [Actinomycetota bacterium]
MKVLGIDPGISNTGYGLVEEAARRLSALASGTIKTAPSDEMAVRLDVLYRGVTEVVERLAPDAVVLEELFFNTNQKSVMAVGQARGVILLACGHAGMPVVEYTPLQVKQTVTGNGNAKKEQVRYMVGALLGTRDLPSSLHECDALAMAICHLHSRRMAGLTGG